MLARLLIALSFLPAFALGTIDYRIQPEPAHRTLRVSMSVPSTSDQESFSIPAWCPGFYFLREYQKKIFDFVATDSEGRPMTVRHEPDSRTWIVANPDRGALRVGYRVLGDDPGLGFFGTSVLGATAFVNGPSAFMYVEGRKEEPIELAVEYADTEKEWKTACALDPGPVIPGATTFKAGGYDELADSPIQMGRFETRSFRVAGIPFTVVFVSRNQRYQCDLDAETARLQAVSSPALQLFGGAAFKRYIYFIHLAVGDFSGGLEHRAGNVQAVSDSRPLDIDDLAAHEYFHAWNVKQIRPKILGPFDYTQPQRTANLWFAEGVTDYYAKITTYRSGLKDQAWLLSELKGQVRELQASQVRRKVSLADCSREAWEHGGFGNGDLSYYTKGLLVGWIFDALIRDATGGRKSLDDVMRLMYARYRLPQPGYPEDGILRAIDEVSGGSNFAIYGRMVQTTEELPYEELIRIGILVDPRTGDVKFDPNATPKQIELRNGWLERASGIHKNHEHATHQAHEGRV